MGRRWRRKRTRGTKGLLIFVGCAQDGQLGLYIPHLALDMTKGWMDGTASGDAFERKDRCWCWIDASVDVW